MTMGIGCYAVAKMGQWQQPSDMMFYWRHLLWPYGFIRYRCTIAKDIPCNGGINTKISEANYSLECSICWGSLGMACKLMGKWCRKHVSCCCLSVAGFVAFWCVSVYGTLPVCRGPSQMIEWMKHYSLVSYKVMTVCTECCSLITTWASRYTQFLLASVLYPTTYY